MTLLTNCRLISWRQKAVIECYILFALLPWIVVSLVTRSPANFQPIGTFFGLAGCIAADCENEPLALRLMDISLANFYGDISKDTGYALFASAKAGILFNQDVPALVLPLDQQILEINTRVFGPNHQRSVERMAYVAADLLRLGRFNEGIPLAEETASAARKLLPATKLALRYTQHELSKAYLLTGQIQRAEPAALEAYSLARQLYGEKDLHTAIAISVLGDIHLEQGRYSEAAAAYQKEVEIERSLGGIDPEWKTIGQMDLAHSRIKQGKTIGIDQQIKEWLKKAPSAKSVAFKRELGTLCLLTHKYEDAQWLLSLSLKQSQAILGPRHPLTQVTMLRLAELYFAQGKPETAHELACQIIKMNGGIEHARGANCASTLNLLGEIREQKGQASEAQHLYLKTIQVRMMDVGERAPKTMEIGNNLVRIDEARGDNLFITF
ncbi:MAG: tetratricopeptide repeat protein [Cyanobacteria bacterium SZAS LIN-3]|nr:tetratricopeptide repeat protein [Cyanobacteria bacterium SZAS LIN-3]